MLITIKRFMVWGVIAGLILSAAALPQAGPLPVASAQVGRAETDDAGNVSALLMQIQALQNQINALRERLSGRSDGSAASSVGGGTSAAAPGGITQVMPSAFAELKNKFDSDTSNDDIVQLNNLRIENITTAPPSLTGDGVIAVIAASRDFGVQCNKYENESDKTSRPMPCPLAPEILYNIGVTAKTHLLLRNRQAATLADIAVGDRINVYGFMDPGQQTFQALIVRNLDRPAVARYIQLNNVEVVEGPLDRNLPTTIVVARKSVSPCLDFEKTTGGSAIPCPLGIETGDGRSGSMPVIWPPKPTTQKYSVTIGKETKVFDRNRNPLDAWSIAPGDALNVYGLWQPGAKALIRAVTVRDLSKPVVEGGAPFRVVVVSSLATDCWQPQSANDVNFVRPIACGVLYNAGVVLYSEKGEAVAKSGTRTGAAIFERLAFGNYTVVASAPGYREAKIPVRIDSRSDQVVSITLSPTSGGGTMSIVTLLTPDGGLTGIVGNEFTSTFTVLGGTAPYRWGATEGQLPPGLTLARETIYCFTTPCPQPTERISVKGKPTTAGAYPFALGVTDASGQSATARFTITIIAP